MKLKFPLGHVETLPVPHGCSHTVTDVACDIVRDAFLENVMGERHSVLGSWYTNLYCDPALTSSQRAHSTYPPSVGYVTAKVKRAHVYGLELRHSQSGDSPMRIQ